MSVLSHKAIVNITSALPETNIYYTLDGTEPNEKSKKYNGEFEIKEGLTIKAIAYKQGFKTSFVSTAVYQKITNNYTIKINSEINKSFTGGGNDALIDGVRGAINWRVGNRWQGVWNKDFEAILDLEKVQNVNTVTIGSLQDTQAWIVFPPETEFYIAGDDMNFKLISTIKAPTEANDYNIQIKELGSKVNADCRYIKIIAKNYGKLPSWHEGAGGLAHTFFDEITIN